MAEEEWRPVVGYEGQYDVSDQGRVRSWRTSGTYGKLRADPLIRKQFVSPRGYWSIVLGKSKTRTVHRLILESFVGLRPTGYEGCHRDGDALNNRLSNLRWDTSAANKADMRKHGTWQHGAAHYATILTEDDIRCIRAEPKFWGVNRMLADRFGCSLESIFAIRKRITWRHI